MSLSICGVLLSLWAGACPPDTQGSCEPCPPLSTTLGPGSPNCFCVEGAYLAPGNHCQECPANTYKEQLGPQSCRPCPQGFHSPRGARQCLCAGYKYPNLHDNTYTCSGKHTSTPDTNEKIPDVVQTQEGKDWMMMTMSVAVATLGVTCSMCILALCYRAHARKRGYRMTSNDISMEIMGDDMEDKVFVGSVEHCDLQGKVKKLKISRLIGRGAFGQVHEAFLILSNSDKRKIAVKKLKDGAGDEDRVAFQTELEQMRLIGRHRNIINLLGTCNIGGSPLLLMELAELGDLRSYLRDKAAQLESYVSVTADGSLVERRVLPITEERELMLFCWQVACGMAHIESLKCIHGDLAARNVLLASGPVAKVSDFGLSRDVYENGYYFRLSKGRLPYKWLSPEALLWGLYSWRSDVWSYGVLLWEVCTHGATPYPGVPPDHQAQLLRAGFRMPQPPNCPDVLYDVMHRCWAEDPRARPSFNQLAEDMAQLLQSSVKREYLDLCGSASDGLQTGVKEGKLPPELQSLLEKTQETSHPPGVRGDASTSGYSSSTASGM